LATRRDVAYITHDDRSTAFIISVTAARSDATWWLVVLCRDVNEASWAYEAKAEAEARKSEAEDEAEAKKIFRGRGHNV